MITLQREPGEEFNLPLTRPELDALREAAMDRAEAMLVGLDGLLDQGDRLAEVEKIALLLALERRMASADDLESEREEGGSDG